MEGARRSAQFRRAWHRMTRSPRTWQFWQLPAGCLAHVIAVVGDSIAIGVAAHLVDSRSSRSAAAVAALLGRARDSGDDTEPGRGCRIDQGHLRHLGTPGRHPLPPVSGLLAPIPRIAMTQWRIRQIAPHRRCSVPGGSVRPTEPLTSPSASLPVSLPGCRIRVAGSEGR
jgi:hypothetical protein